MKIKTQDLTGPALDWAVAKCEGRSPVVDGGAVFYQPKGTLFGVVRKNLQPLYYSTNWAQGGPIIEREEIALHAGDAWFARCKGYDGTGPTPLIAAMRCYVASKLGEEAEIPEELK